mmetsp:Transcript_22558/g.73971  ORF Transcript_22558/g.73971 Transcript_22558/m.73971 type:complete len:209 (+) Transcript_22558:801-1427(+)
MAALLQVRLDSDAAFQFTGGDLSVSCNIHIELFDHLQEDRLVGVLGCCLLRCSHQFLQDVALTQLRLALVLLLLPLLLIVDDPLHHIPVMRVLDLRQQVGVRQRSPDPLVLHLVELTQPDGTGLLSLPAERCHLLARSSRREQRELVDVMPEGDLSEFTEFVHVSRRAWRGDDVPIPHRLLSELSAPALVLVCRDGNGVSLGLHASDE